MVWNKFIRWNIQGGEAFMSQVYSAKMMMCDGVEDMNKRLLADILEQSGYDVLEDKKIEDGIKAFRDDRRKEEKYLELSGKKEEE
jgi:hypothetical protein